MSNTIFYSWLDQSEFRSQNAYFYTTVVVDVPGGSDQVRGTGGGGGRAEAEAPALGLVASVGRHRRRLDGGGIDVCPGVTGRTAPGDSRGGVTQWHPSNFFYGTAAAAYLELQFWGINFKV